MPTLETPPNIAPSTGVPPPPRPPRIATEETAALEPKPAASKVKAGRFGELDHSELVHLLDTLDDERTKARFRESIYISLFFWVAVVLFVIFAPRFFPRQPVFVVPSGLQDKPLTNLTIPPDVRRALEHPPKFKTPPKAIRTPEPPMPAAAPQAPVQQPAQQQPPPKAAPAPQQAAAPAPPPVVQQSPFQPPRPQQQQAALPSAPTPSTVPARPDFGNPNTSARDMVQQSTRSPHTGGRGVAIEGSPNGPVAARGMGTDVDILSDTQGVDFNPYLQKILREIYETWLPLLPEEARPPLNKQGETLIRFTIQPDGEILMGDMHLDGSTHDYAIDKSCWGSITGVGQFPPLPKQFHGPNLELRIHYLVNKEAK